MEMLEPFIEPVIKFFPKVPNAILALIFGYLLVMIARYLIKESLVVAKTPRALTQMILSIANFFMWVLLIAAILKSLGLGQVALALSGSVAITGVLLATGASTLVTDLIAGLYLVKDRDFNVGYTIKSGEIEGEIEKIDLRKVRIRDKSGKLHVVPSSIFDKNQWIVLDEGDK